MPPYNVLIVDDQRDIRRVLRAGLETIHKNIKVVDVPSGEEAILVISRQPVDLLVTDIRLPGISGLELKERAEIRNPNLKFILITGMTDGKVREEVTQAGADAFFFKPVEMSDFLDAVQDCLNIAAPAPITRPKGVPKTEGKETLAPAEKEVSPIQGLTDRLSSLRRELQAVSVVLMDEHSQVIARAGEIPEAIDQIQLKASLITASKATVEISSHLSADIPRGVMYFPGRLYDLLITPVGPSAMLMLTLHPATWNDENVARLFRLARSAGQDLQIILLLTGSERQPVPEIKASATEIPLSANTKPIAKPAAEPIAATPKDEDSLPELEAIFAQALNAQYNLEEIDAFWDAAAGVEAGGANQGDGISYDQARQLGIAPEEKSA